MALQLLVLLLPLQMEDKDLAARPWPRTSAVTLALDGLARLPASPLKARTSLNSTVLLVGWNRLNLHHIAWRDTILLATGTNDRVHKPSRADARANASHAHKLELLGRKLPCRGTLERPKHLGERLAPRRQAGIAKLE